MSKPNDQTGDDALGLSASIDRRDILNSTLLAAGSVLLGAVAPIELLGQEDWTGFGGVGDYANCNGNTWDVVSAGHKIRDHAFEKKTVEPIDTGEIFDCVVVGGGISGLAAALFYQRETKSKNRCLILENHPVFGGEAKRNEFLVDGHRLMIHQGSAACFPPLPGTFLETFYSSIGVDWSQFRYQEWSGPKPPMKLETAPYPVGGPTSGFFFGQKFGSPQGSWLIDPWGKRLAGAPISDEAKRELLGMKDADLKPFSKHRYQPKTHGDEASRHLDTLTIEQHLTETYGLRPETVRTFLSPVTGGGSGLGADVLSAYAEYAADVLLPWDYSKGAQMFPGGNAGIARHIMKSLIPGAIAGPASMASICKGKLDLNVLDRPDQPSRIRLGSTVISVRHNGDPQRAERVEILYTRKGNLYRLSAKSVILAGGSWTTRHIAKDMPENCRQAYAQFHRAPCLMANVAVRNWRFLYDLGLSECRWFEGFGNYITMREVARFGSDPATINPDMPTVLNLKILFSHPGLSLQEQVVRGRTELFSTPYRDYERRIREQLTTLFASSGFNAKRDIAGIILNRWGHAYVSPQPGFFFGQGGKPAPGEVLRQSAYGRISFGNSDLSGIMDHRMSILEARRAVQQVVASTGVSG
jgi:spermidine dehydrogenase